MPDQPQQDSVLQQLKKQEAEFKAKMKDAKKKIVHREAELKKQCAAIIGKAILAEAQENTAIIQTIIPLIEKHIKSKRDKEMIEFLKEKKD